MDRGAWWATVQVVAKSWTWLSNLNKSCQRANDLHSDLSWWWLEAAQILGMVLSPQDALGLLARIPNPGPATHKTQSRGRSAAVLLAFLLQRCCRGWPVGWWACELALAAQSARDHQPRLGFQKEAWGTWWHTGHLGCQEKRLKRDLTLLWGSKGSFY